MREVVIAVAAAAAAVGRSKQNKKKKEKAKTKFTKKLQRGKKFCESAESQYNKKESKKELHFTANLVAAAGNQGARAALVDKQ